jgi:hypothetical protein
MKTADTKNSSSQPPVPFHQVRQDLYKLLKSNSMNGYPDSSDHRLVDRWLNHSSDEEITELSVAIDIVNSSETSNDPAVFREADVIRYIISETLNNGAHMPHAHGFLSVRSAFCSDRAISTKPPLTAALPLYLGIGCDFKGNPLPEYARLSPENFHAVLRYIYEFATSVLFQGGQGKLPVKEIYVTAQGGHANETSTHFILQINDEELIALITAHRENVDALINLSLGSDTADPVRLAVLMNYEGHATLSSGAL